jgi:iron-sulfur cluster insertion protein
MKLFIAESALLRIDEILKNEKPGSMLRISVTSGGCSGFQYGFEIDVIKNHDDYIFEERVVIDEISLSFVCDAVLSFESSLSQSSFVLSNPNASSRCGCGNSFSI